MEKKVTIKGVSTKWGAINGLIGIIFFIIIDVMGTVGDQGIQSFMSLSTFGVLVFLAHREFKVEGDGFMSYGQGLGIGTLVAVVSGLITGIFTYIYISFTNTGYISQRKEQQLIELENSGMSDMQIEQAMRFSEGFMTPTILAGLTILFAILFGFMLSLIIPVFTRKSEPEVI